MIAIVHIQACARSVLLVLTSRRDLFQVKEFQGKADALKGKFAFSFVDGVLDQALKVSPELAT